MLLTSLSSAWFAPGYLFMALFLYGICSTLLAYVASLFCDTVLGSFAVVAGYQAVSRMDMISMLETYTNYSQQFSKISMLITLFSTW